MQEGVSRMSPVKRAACVLAAGAALGMCVAPSIAKADPVVDAAVAQLNDLGIGTLTGMPSGRTTYRTYDEIQAELTALATTYPDMVVVKTAPYKSTQGRDIKYVEITNNPTAKDGKPVFFNMGAIHGNETAAAEDSLEFAYDVLKLAQTNTKVKALFDKVRFIDMPVVNADGHVLNRRSSCGGLIVPPATCSTSSQGIDMNRNYPFGWGSNIGVSFTARGSGPGSEPEVKNTMEIVTNNQVVSLLTQHTNSRAIFYPGLEIFAGQTPDLNNGYRDLALAMAHATADGYTNVRDSAHDYETSGETVDWSYYATRGIANTLELVGSVSGCPQALPNYLNCTTADYTGTPGPTSTATQTARFAGHPVRNAMWLNLVYSAQSAAHSQITGTAVPGATLKITKDFNLYTAPIKNNTTPRDDVAATGHPDAPRDVDDGPGQRPVQVGHEPVGPARRCLRGRRRARGPARFLRRELHAHLHGGQRHRPRLHDGARRQGRRRQCHALHQRRRRRLGLGNALAGPRHAGHVRRVHAGPRQGLPGEHHRHRDLHGG